MARLVEVVELEDVSRSLLRVRVGDIVYVHATGGQVRDGADSIELLGAFVTAVIGDNGVVMEPAGIPNVILFRAYAVGTACIDVVKNSAFEGCGSVRIALEIER